MIIENIEKHGVQVRYWSPEMMKLFQDTWQEVVADQTQDPFFKKVWDDLQEFRSSYEYWQRHGFLPREVGLSQ